MANKILHTTIMQKNTSGDRNIIYPKTVTKNIIDGSTTLDQTLNTLKSTDVSSKTTEFKQADTRENLVSGEALATSHGKIMKLISDLKSLAYTDTVGVSNLDSTLTTAYNNRVTTDKVTTSTTITSAGYIADARVVNNLQNQINTVNNNIGLNPKYYYGDDLDNATKSVYPDITSITNYDFVWRPKTNNQLTNGWVSRVLGIYGSDNYETQMMLSYSSKTPMAMRYKNDGVWTDWDRVVLKSELPVMESHVVNPSGKDSVQITLNNTTRDDLINVTIASCTTGVILLGCEIENVTGNILNVKFTTSVSTNVRINILYYIFT